MGALRTRMFICISVIVLSMRIVGSYSNLIISDVVEGFQNRLERQKILQDTTNPFTLASTGTFILSQVFHATTADTLPTLPTWRLSFQNDFAKINVCERRDVARCMDYGRTDSRMPERLQGAWWGDGLDTEAVAFATGKGWDPIKNVLTMEPLVDRLVAYYSSNSTQVGLYWTSSGAALLNAYFTVTPFFDIIFNEDVNFGQIVVGFYLFGIRISIPVYILNWTMQWMDGQETWLRRSTLFNVIPLPEGDYNLRRVVNGTGQPAYWYDKGWLTADSGRPIAVPYLV